MNKIIVLSGGISPEREVSIVSANYVTEALEAKGYSVTKLDPKDFVRERGVDYRAFIDKIREISPLTVFNALHGGHGEDGTIQKILELFNINFTGSGSKASLLGMDKVLSMLIAKEECIPVAEYLVLDKNEDKRESLKKILDNIPCPLVIKPTCLGSSVGISIVEERSMITTALKEAYEEESRIIAQRYVPGKEITIGVLEGKALPVLEVKPKSGWFDYSNKYDRGKSNYEVPAKIEEEKKKVVREYAEKIYSDLGCKDYARVDFRFDGLDFYFLEVNILPGITDHSIFCLAAEAAGITYNNLIEKIVKLSIN